VTYRCYQSFKFQFFFHRHQLYYCWILKCPTCISVIFNIYWSVLWNFSAFHIIHCMIVISAAIILYLPASLTLDVSIIGWDIKTNCSILSGCRRVINRHMLLLAGSECFYNSLFVFPSMYRRFFVWTCWNVRYLCTAGPIFGMHALLAWCIAHSRI
jgi:hypothetical protein